MARTLKRDNVLFLTTMVLVLASIAMVYSASAVMAQERYGQAYLFVFKQVFFVVAGVGAMSIAMNVDYRKYRRPALIGAALAATAAALVLVLIVGPEIKGTRRWLEFSGVRIQPSELAKLAMILFTAFVLERRMDRIDDVRHALLPIGVVLGGVVCLVLLQPDFGSSMAILGTVAVMVFAAGLPYRYLAWLGAGIVPVVALLAVSAEYRIRRLMAFWNPWDDPLGSGFQVIQSLIAVGTGGVTGRGIGDGVQKRFYLPEPHSDFIFAVISEEFGLVGASVIVACFVLIMWRGLRTAMRAPDQFGAFLALGITMMIAAQAFVNISVVLGLLPTKGIPLPFVSAGGSSMIVSLAGMGVLLNVSQYASAEEPE